MLAPDKSDRGISEIANEVLELFLPDAMAEAVEKVKAVAKVDDDPLAEKAIIWAAGVGVAFDAQSTIRTLRVLVKPSKPLYGFQKENIIALESVRDSIEELQSALRTMPSRAWLLLFANELTGTETEAPTVEIQNRAKQRTRAISGLLAGMRARCAALLEVAPGKHKGADWGTTTVQ
jgi:hypothetical protein